MLLSLRRNKALHLTNCPLRLAAAGVCIWTLVAAAAPAPAPQPRSLVTPSQIIGAMQDRKLPTRGVQVAIGVPISTAGNNPPLDIEAFTTPNTHDVRLRVSCHDPSACLPFFATATYPEAIDPLAFQIKTARPPATGAQAPPGVNSIAQSSLAQHANKQANSNDSQVIRSGSPATLDFDGERVHVRVEVICLEAGATGDKIRVTTRDHKQVYVAEIVAPRSLKGTLTR